MMQTFTTSKGAELFFRLAEESDLALVLDSWTQSVAADPPWQYKAGVRGTYPRQPYPIPPLLLRQETDSLLKKRLPELCIVCACDAEDPDHVMGWSACHRREVEGEDWVLDFVYVKTSFRGYGVGSELLRNIWGDGWRKPKGAESADPVPKWTIAYRTGMLLQRWPQRVVRWQWNPYRMWY